MNKLSALYKVGKHLKGCSPCAGSLNIEAILDTTVIGTLHSELRSEADSIEKKTEIQFGEEKLRFEHIGKGPGTACCSDHHPSIGMQGLKKAHNHYSHCCSGPFSKLEHALFMLKVLDKTVYQVNPDGTRTFALDLMVSDLPEGMQAMAQSRCCGAGGYTNFEDCCPEHAKAWLERCGCMELDPQSIVPVSLNLTLAVTEGYVVSALKATLTATAKDKSGEVHQVTINVDGQCN